MDRKLSRILAVACALCCLAALPLAASAATIFDGNISTTYITIFRDIAAKLPFDTDYVFFRSGQYEYILVAGDLEFTGSMFRGSNLTQYILQTDGNYNNTYRFGTVTLDSFNLAPSNNLVYSNLGSYPDLYQREDYALLGVIVANALLFCCMMIRPTFDFVMRMRGVAK